jgi:uncharacterized protein (TIGR03435 family)
MQRFEVVGPDWIDTERFDVLAKVPLGTTKAQFQVMLQQLLVERFGLTIHREMKVMSVYALVVGKGQPKLEKSESLDEPSFKELFPNFKDLPPPGRGRLTPPRHVVFRNMTMSDFAERLSRRAKDYFDRKIIDKTGIGGAYNFELQWFSVQTVERQGGERIFEAIEKQLGLRLEPGKAPVETLVIDKVLKVPIDN